MIPGIHHDKFRHVSNPTHHARVTPTTPRHYSSIGTIVNTETPTLNMVISPANPSLTIPVSNGDIVATIQVFWSNGNIFTGTLEFVAPNFDHDGDYAIDGTNLVVNNATNINSINEVTVEHVTIEAMQL
jgi:hypothetical protein